MPGPVEAWGSMLASFRAARMAAAAKARFRVHVGDAIRVGSGAVARNFGKRGRTAGGRVFGRFQNDDRRPFAHHKSTSCAAEGTTGGGGVFIRGGKRGQSVEASHAEFVQHGVRATGQHEIGFAAANQMGRFTDGLGTRRASRQAVGGWSPQVVLQRQVAGRSEGLLLGLKLTGVCLLRGLAPGWPVVYLVTNAGHMGPAGGNKVEGAFSCTKVDAAAIWVWR